MEIFILDANRQYVGILDSVISFIWTERYNGYGDFQIKITPDHPDEHLLQVDRYIRIKESNKLMVIRTRSVTVNHDEGDTLTITGRSMEAALLERVLYPNREVDGEIDYQYRAPLAELATVIVRNRIERGSSDTERDAIDGFGVYWPAEPGPMHTLISKPMTLYQMVQDLCRFSGFGFQVVFSIDTASLFFQMYKGVDRSESIVFSPDLDNLYNVEQFESTEDFKNVAYVYHKDRGLGRVEVYRPGYNGVSGINRRVLFVDASELDEPSTAELRMYGRDALNQDTYSKISILDGEAVAHQLEYREDYGLGDIVTLMRDTEKSKVRVVEHIRSFDSDGIKEYPTFERVD